MDTEQIGWLQRYQVALRRFLRQGPSGSLLPAVRLGRRAVTFGLETLDVARLHERVLTALASSAGSSASSRHKAAEQAKVFFAETIVSIEETHRGAMKAGARIDRLTRTLHRRTNESSAAAGQLERAIAQRQAAEEALRRGADQHLRLLADAQGQQKRLRHQTRELLSAQEDERENTSRELRDEIVQALLAIDLSLLAVKTLAGVDTARLEKELATAQRLVGQLCKRGCG